MRLPLIEAGTVAIGLYSCVSVSLENDRNEAAEWGWGKECSPSGGRRALELPSTVTPDYEMPAEPVLEAYRQREAWELGEAAGGATLRRFEIRQPDPFLRWILSLEGDAVIESPPSLQNALRTLANQVADLYRGEANA